MTLFNPGRLWYTIPGTIFCTVRKDLYMEIQKSGMYHRLDRLMKLAEGLEEE